MTGPTVEERIVHLVREGRALYEWRCTPTDLHALVVGRLYSEGLIERADLSSKLEIVQQAAETLVVLNAPLGTMHHKRVRLQNVPIPGSDVFGELFKTMFTTIDERYSEGGMHGAALVRDGTIVVQAEDVGRHNAVDKAIGLGVIAGLDIAAHGLIVTARVSGEIARKASESGAAWLASRSIPTTLAVSIARIGALPIIGRAASKSAFIYQ